LRLGDGIEAITGWGLAHLANISARLKDGELGYQALSRIMEKFLLPNLFTCHNEGELFQMDANLGFSAAILEMLVFSKPGYIELLPALPKQLGKGSISGVRCRGCIALIDLQWDVPEKQVSVILKSDMDQDIVLKLPFETESFEWTGAAGKVQPFIDNDRKLKLSMRRNINILIKIRIS
jgi:alpha-L-fucosidase 2